MNKKTQTHPAVHIHNAAHTSPIILSGPHNGRKIPASLIASGDRPLGLPKSWFTSDHPERRHEACDWGVAELFNCLQTKNNTITFISAPYSRLVVDLNRAPEHTITLASNETDHPIPHNTNLSPMAKERRIAQYYTPYHTALDTLLQDVKNEFGTVLWLDIHSFAPIWNGTPRDIHIGSLKNTATAHSQYLESILRKQFGDAFKSDTPYNMQTEPFRTLAAGADIARRNNTEYFGIEIRNDLIEGDNNINAMAEKILQLIRQYPL